MKLLFFKGSIFFTWNYYISLVLVFQYLKIQKSFTYIELYTKDLSLKKFRSNGRRLKVFYYK